MCKFFECTYWDLLEVCSRLIEYEPSGICPRDLIVRLEKTSDGTLHVGVTNNAELLDTCWNREAQENNK